LNDTVLLSHSGTVLNNPVAYVAAVGILSNVKVSPANDYTGAIHDPYLNYAAIDFKKNISGMKSGKIEFKTSAADNVLTDLFTITDCATAKVKLTVSSVMAYAQSIKTLEFMINSYVITASPIITTIINESNANYNISMTPSVLYANGTVTISVTCDQSGGLLSGESVTVFGSIEYTIIDSGTCSIKRITD
jgi:hypothetical protein